MILDRERVSNLGYAILHEKMPTYRETEWPNCSILAMERQLLVLNARTQRWTALNSRGVLDNRLIVRFNCFICMLMRSVCISDGDTVNERKVEVEKGENEGIE